MHRPAQSGKLFFANRTIVDQRGIQHFAGRHHQQTQHLVPFRVILHVEVANTGDIEAAGFPPQRQHIFVVDAERGPAFAQPFGMSVDESFHLVLGDSAEADGVPFAGVVAGRDKTPAGSAEIQQRFQDRSKHVVQFFAGDGFDFAEAPDQTFHPFLPNPLGFFEVPLAGQGQRQLIDFFRLERFFDIEQFVGRTDDVGHFFLVVVGERGHDDNFDVFVDFPNPFGGFQAVPAGRHAHIGKHDCVRKFVVQRALDHFERIFALTHGIDFVFHVRGSLDERFRGFLHAQPGANPLHQRSRFVTVS